MNINLNSINEIAVIAGQSILNIYNGSFEVKYKEDRSPLTEADRASHEIIVKGLKKLYPEMPVHGISILHTHLPTNPVRVPCELQWSHQYYYL